jgi:Zn-dependent metalloprotease
VGSSLGSVDLAGSGTSPQAATSKDAEYAAAGGSTAEARSRDGDTKDDDRAIKAAAKRALVAILKERMGAVGDEAVEPDARRVYVDRQAKNLHVRFQQSIHGLPVEGAALHLHVAPEDGTVLALNGEFVPSTSMELRVLVECHEALEVARREAGGDGVAGGEQWEWTSPCVPAAVLGDDGRGHKCWKRTAEIRTPGQPVRREVLFASGVNGRLVARHPQTFGARSLETRNCQTQKENCAVVSTSPNPISTGDKAIDAAHNNAIKVYDFLKNMYGRDSLDNAGMTIVSQAHYDKACTSGSHGTMLCRYFVRCSANVHMLPIRSVVQTTTPSGTRKRTPCRTEMGTGPSTRSFRSDWMLWRMRYVGGWVPRTRVVSSSIRPT